MNSYFYLRMLKILEVYKLDEQSGNTKKMITTFGLVTMIITAIFGFGNVSNAYLQILPMWLDDGRIWFSI